MAIAAEPASSPCVPPPSRTPPLMIKEIPDLDPPDRESSRCSKGGIDGDGKQAARVMAEDAAADAEAISPCARFAGYGVAAAMG